MKILLHICCGPCATYPYEVLKRNGWEVVGFFYNPNIHPYKEYERRLATLKDYAQKAGLEVIYKDEYDLEEFLRRVVYREAIRCQFCYYLRLKEAARAAKEGGFDAFTTTLLVSPYQDHHLIQEVASSAGKEVGINFHYDDFRSGYNQGIQLSKEYELYRQVYCGCIYSEKERAQSQRA
jgi:hypothetical protein